MNFDPKGLISLLKLKGVEFDNGLSEVEIQKAESHYDFRFPPDLRLLLECGLPISPKFPNWRSTAVSDREFIEDRFELPVDGMLFDIEYNKFWHMDFGKKPFRISKAKEICREFMRKQIKMIPIYAHRFIPMSPAEINNPIFSISQTDIIIYGQNLTEYLANEFHLDLDLDRPAEEPKFIPFWSTLLG